MKQIERRWRMVLLGGVLLLGGCAGGGATPGDEVEIQVRWVVDSLPAGTEVAIFEALEDDVLASTASYEAGESIALGAPIADGVLRTGFDEPARFVVVLTNASEESFRFWAAPHLPLPMAAEPDLVITCLCTGELYEVPAGGSWRRVVEYGLSRRSDVRKPLSITHVFTRGELPEPE
ncbi:MAG: hypothetical protein HOH95_05995 [Dehalococcoidia bacterium]|jgi:hypothetical protein|nr:hypothetical protein [Dehalococcoidia bacterium]